MLINRKQAGFTIVELLIVIIVIAILATLIITAYNGVQVKARNTQRIASAKDWQNVITAYVVQYNQYPANINIGVSGTVGVCLGDGYPTDWDTDSEGDCYASTNVKHPNSTWDNQLKLVSPTLPNFNKTPVSAGDGSLRLGIVVRADNTFVDGVQYYPTMVYYLEGADQDCILRPVVSGTSSTSGAISSGGDSSMTTCRIKLPDPANS